MFKEIVIRISPDIHGDEIVAPWLENGTKATVLSPHMPVKFKVTTVNNNNTVDSRIVEGLQDVGIIVSKELSDELGFYLDGESGHVVANI